MLDLTGHNLGPYRLLEQVGAGGMATIYKAYQPAMDRYVAIKVLPQHMASNPNFRNRFQIEVRAIAHLEHRSILPIYDVGEDRGIPYMVMRYTDGGTLADLIAGGSLTVERVVRLTGQVAEALAYAHCQGVIHRDVKPANVLIGRQGDALLTDFGIAKILEETLDLTGEGARVGTPAYMAPEQIQGRVVDGRTDIYALGVVLYQALTGECPFMGDTPMAVAMMHLHKSLRPPRQLNRAIPEALERVILRAMAKDPDNRFPTAEALADALREVAARLPSAPPIADLHPSAAPPPQPLIAHARLRSQPWNALVGGALIVVALLAALLIIRRDDSPCARDNTEPSASPRDLGAIAQPALVIGRGGGASTCLDGQVLWTFNGTILSGPTADGVPLRASTAARADRNNLLSLTETLDTRGAPSPLLRLTDDERAHNAANQHDAYYLSVASIVNIGADHALVFYSKLQGPNIFELKHVGSGIARLTADSTSARRDPTLLFDAPEPLFQDGAVVHKSHVHIYSCSSAGWLKTACSVARAPLERASERTGYQFWDGQQWVADIGRAKQILEGPPSGFSVAWNPYLKRFLAVYSPLFSDDVVMRTAPRPEGPWSDPVVMFTAIKPGAGNISDTREHPELAAHGGRTVVISYVRPLGDFKEEVRLAEVTFR